MGIVDDIRERILVLDGAMGTLLQQGMGEEEALRAYVEAGADIITTNSFNANRISLAAEGKAGQAAELAYAAAVRARRVADAAATPKGATTILFGFLRELGITRLPAEAFKRALEAQFAKKPKLIPMNIEVLEFARKWVRENVK